MEGEALNRDLLPGNACFGCGPDNPRGLGIERLPENWSELLTRLDT